MKRSANLLLLALFGALGPALAAQPSGFRPVKPDVIAQSGRSCANSVSSTGVDEQRLRADGWSEGTLQSKGKEAASPLRFFGRAGTMLLLTREEGRPAGGSCVVMASIKSTKHYPQVVEAMTAALGGSASKAKDESVMWLLDGGKAAQMAPTGSNEKPSVRIVVVFVSGKKE